MVRGGKERELLIDFDALPTSQNKGLKPLSDQGSKRPRSGSQGDGNCHLPLIRQGGH